MIVGFTKAIEMTVFNQEKNAEKLLQYRNCLLQGLLENNSGLLINGSLERRLPHNLNLTVLNVNGAKFHKILKSKIICSSGSACSNGQPSHVLLAMGRSFKEAESSIRLSIGLNTNLQIRSSYYAINYWLFTCAILNLPLLERLFISTSFSDGVIGFFVRFLSLSSFLNEFLTNLSSSE